MNLPTERHLQELVSLLGQFSLSQEAEKTWLQCESDRWRSKYCLEGKINE